LGRFPIYVESTDQDTENGDGHTTEGQSAVAQLFDAYVKDHRVFSCASKSSTTTQLTRYMAPTGTTYTADQYTFYGYDPGHTPTHATAGVFGDYGATNSDNHDNSRNHGADGPGQNIAIGAGSVEWWDAADARATRNASDVGVSDHIYSSTEGTPWSATTFPEELETDIVKDVAM
jgi:hypothetical protein